MCNGRPKPPSALGMGGEADAKRNVCIVPGLILGGVEGACDLAEVTKGARKGVTEGASPGSLQVGARSRSSGCSTTLMGAQDAAPRGLLACACSGRAQYVRFVVRVL